MRTHAFVIAFVLLAFPFAFADDAAQARFPLQVSVFTIKATAGTRMKSGMGKANVKEGSSSTGIDFTYDCSLPFFAYGLERPYPGAWKEKGKVLTIRITQIGDANIKAECDLQVTPLPTVYAEKGGKLESVSHAELHKIEEKIEKRERENDDERPGHPMRLKVSIVEAQWADQGKLRVGSGKGNVIEKGVTTGFEFGAHCTVQSLQKTSSPGYVGRWAENKTKLIIAAPAPGDAESPTCELDVELQPAVFVRDADGKVTAVPLHIYNKSKTAKRSVPRK